MANNPVVIGVVAHPTTETEGGSDAGPPKFVTGSEYIAASYIKWLEQAGARVIGVPFSATPEETELLFKQMNGVLFPGGATELGGSARTLYELAEASNAAGDFLPVWGTCLGFQWLMQLGARNESDVLCLGCFDSMNLENKLDLTAAAPTSRLFGSLSSAERSLVAAEKVTFNNHHDGVTPEAFAADAGLAANWTILSTNQGRQGKVYVSTVEHRTRPYYGIQWHAEKSQFEFYPSHVNHSADATALSNSMAKFFIGEARRSRPPPTPYEVEDGTTTIYTGGLPVSHAMLPSFQSVVLVKGAEAAAIAPLWIVLAVMGVVILAMIAVALWRFAAALRRRDDERLVSVQSKAEERPGALVVAGDNAA